MTAENSPESLEPTHTGHDDFSRARNLRSPWERIKGLDDNFLTDLKVIAGCAVTSSLIVLGLQGRQEIVEVFDPNCDVTFESAYPYVEVKCS